MILNGRAQHGQRIFKFQQSVHTQVEGHVQQNLGAGDFPDLGQAHEFRAAGRQLPLAGVRFLMQGCRGLLLVPEHAARPQGVAQEQALQTAGTGRKLQIGIRDVLRMGLKVGAVADGAGPGRTEIGYGPKAFLAFELGDQERGGNCGKNGHKKTSRTCMAREVGRA